MAWDSNPLYALLHEAIYCQGGQASAWAAHRVRCVPRGGRGAGSCMLAAAGVVPSRCRARVRLHCSCQLTCIKSFAPP